MSETSQPSYIMESKSQLTQPGSRKKERSEPDFIPLQSYSSYMCLIRLPNYTNNVVYQYIAVSTKIYQNTISKHYNTMIHYENTH